MVAHPDIGQCLSFLLFGLALLLVSQPVAMYHLTHTITSAFYMVNIYLDLEGTFLAGKRNKTEGTFLAGKRNKTEGAFLAGKRNFQGTSQPLRDCGLCELFQPSGASGSYAQIFPTHTTYKQEIYTRKQLTMIRKHKLLQNRETIPLPRH